MFCDSFDHEATFRSWLVQAVKLREGENETEAEGDKLALGLNEALGLCEADELALGERDVLALLDGLCEAEAELELLGERLADGLREAEELELGERDAEGDREALEEAEGERDAEGETPAGSSPYISKWTSPVVSLFHAPGEPPLSAA